MGLQLDILTAIEERDKGIKVAMDHADHVNENWSEGAYKLLQEFLKETHGEFMGEHVRSYAAVVDFPLPPSSRAWGGIIRKAALAGLIKKVGHGQVANPKAHACFASIWTKN